MYGKLSTITRKLLIFANIIKMKKWVFIIIYWLIGIAKVYSQTVDFSDHSVGICNDSTVWGCGYNFQGQIGDSSNMDTNLPVKLEGLYNVVRITAGPNHTLALDDDGTVWSWGMNNYGQLGHTTSNYPLPVLDLSGVKFIEAGHHYSAIIDSAGYIWCWGWNSDGQLGNLSTANSSSPVQVSGLTNMISVKPAGEHTLALKDDGTVWAWGENTSGELGNGTTVDNITPTMVDGLENIIQIAAGGINVPFQGGHSMALKDDGTVWTWGENQFGQLGQGNTADLTIPTQIMGLDSIIGIACGPNHQVALKSNGTVWTWGWNGYGALGNGTSEDAWSPIQVPNIDNVVQINSELHGTIAVKADGTFWAWGKNDVGQLGIGNDNDQDFATQIQINCFSLMECAESVTIGNVEICDGDSILLGGVYRKTSGTFYDSLLTISGCDSIIQTLLTINSVNSSVMQEGALLTASEGATYQWLNCSTMMPISGATNQSYTATSSGDYAVIVTNNNCKDTSICYTITVVGVIENNFGHQLLLYPNPTDGNFAVALGDHYSYVKITITSINGKVIESKMYNESELINLQLEDPAGVYLLIIESDDKKAVIRLVKN